MKDQKRTINASNIKCHGCARSISDKLSSLEGVSDVNVLVEDGLITYTSAKENTTDVAALLEQMGYPETDPTLLQTAKSYINCAKGRMKS